MEHIKNFKQLKTFLETKDNVEFAYLFGSALQGFFNKESDIDIAVYLSGDDKTFFSERLKLCDTLSKITGQSTNVVVLNQINSLFFKFVVLKEGRLICENNPKARIDFEIKTLNFYYDFQPFIKAYHQKYLEKNI